MRDPLGARARARARAPPAYEPSPSSPFPHSHPRSFGAQSCVIAQAKKGGVDVILNESSKRLNPTLVSFVGNERALGEAATTQIRTNMANTITNVKRLLGAKFAEPGIKAELETHANLTAIEMPDGDIGFDVSYMGEDRRFSATQVAAMMLTKCKQVVQLNNPGCTSVDMVISVPPFFTDAQRRAVKDAAHIAGVNCLRLLNEGTAAALSYGIFKGAKKEFPEGKETVCLFLDMGHAAFTATVASFTNASLKVMASVSDGELGSRDLDVAIAKYFASEFKAKFGIDAWKNKKARVKIMVAAEKAKISISPHGVNQCPVSIECLMEDRDFNGQLTAEKLDELCGAEFTARISSVIARALQQSGMRDYADFAAIELVGGGMRPRLVKRAAATALKMPLDEATGHGLSQSMNLDESIARGCAMACAALSPVFRVKPFDITDKVSYPVNVTWDAASGALSSPVSSSGSSEAAGMDLDEDGAAPSASSSGGSCISVFKTGDNVVTKVATMKATAALAVAVEYAPGPEHEHMFPLGAATQLGKYNISGFPADLTTESTKMRLQVKYDFDGLVSVTHAEVLREIKEAPVAEAAVAAVAAPMTAPATDVAPEAGATDDMPASVGAEAPTTKKKRFKRIDLKVELDTSSAVAGGTGLSPGAGMSAAALRDAVDEELRMCRTDADIRATQDTRNSLEAFIYSTRSALEDSLRAFGTEAERASVSALLTDTETWLYGDGFESDTATYKAKLKELESKTAPLQSRKWENDNRRPAGEALMAAVDEVRAVVANRTNRHGHLSDSDRDILRAAAEKAEHWWREAQDAQKDRELFQAPAVATQEISAKREQLMRECAPIMGQKPPVGTAFKAEPRPAAPVEPASAMDEGDGPPELDGNQGSAEPEPKADESPAVALPETDEAKAEAASGSPGAMVD